MLLHIKESLYYLQVQNGNFTEKFREMIFTDESIRRLREASEDESWIEELTASMLKHEFAIQKAEEWNTAKSKKIWENLENDKKSSRLFRRKQLVFEALKEQYQAVFADLEYFPVGKDEAGEEEVFYENSWYGERTYGGERKHEGTDIMTSNNQRGYFPVYSMTDGIVEKKGWLKLGGWRIGIRAFSGGYFYYAHLYDYAEELSEGDIVKAGQLLGYVGDSGYSETEGTVGNFDVHLHLGIYIKDSQSGQEISVNPYWILRFLENKKLSFVRKT